MQTIELLAPARDLTCGIAAIDHGADAVYIGAERFGARAAVGNSVNDIRQLCDYAHQYGAKVYVTVNTIVYDSEMDDTRRLLGQLSSIGVDAILVQDMGILELAGRASVPAIALHASTQTDNRTVEKVRWLRSLGFRRVVLARELSLAEIKAIHAAVPDVELEVFVHGALCVSYSGVCYASQHCFGRSANRGACAQFCRLRFDLVDSDGRMIEQGRHLLSLKDMCRIDMLEPLLEAGVVSFKIEGRLKDVFYVKNVVAAYSQRLDEIVRNNPQRYRRASLGRCHYHFVPNLRKTFNRGFTHYFMEGRQPDIASFDTPKAMGEYVGQVKELRQGSLTVAGTARFVNGDGLCFINDKHELEGFRVNKVVNNRLFPLRLPVGLRPGMSLYRNNDQEFERLLSGASAERRIPVSMRFEATDEGFALTLSLLGVADGDVVSATSVLAAERVPSQKPQRDNMVRQLTKLGGTPYVCEQVEIDDATAGCFVPSSQLADLRRRAVELLRQRVADIKPVSPVAPSAPATLPQPSEYQRYTYLYNIANQSARQFYARQGLPHAAAAFELRSSHKEPQADEANDEALLLMQCRHCLRYSLGGCPSRHGRQPQWREPLFLVLSDGRRFRLHFDCRQCQMNVFSVPQVKPTKQAHR